MVNFNEQSLFSSGPHRLIVGGLTRRLVDQPAPGDIGSNPIDHGLLARNFTLVGSLLADDINAMRKQLDAIEALVDGRAHTLTDREQTWERVVLTAFEPGGYQRTGPRVRVNYTARFQQVMP